ncbi:MAG: DUF2075 domain-containing protein [Deltaproteobacteria bacterium]|nr:MAG: DUF2075 domain-containing protein [Deltaproteobacteria bacterium]
MYLKHFGFSRKPFAVTPNPAFIFLSETHREAFAHLLYGIQNHAGFIVLTGEVGTGKTTVLRTLLNQLDDERYKIALIFNPALSAIELLRNILREFGLDPGHRSLDDLHQQLNRYLLAQNREGHTVVLIVDEAQNLAPDVLEQVRLLSNLETETDKLIQIVLVGQPELDRMLACDELRQLRQRVTVRYSLTRMSNEDTRRYIEHRIAVAGGRQGLFSLPALKYIQKKSGGIPRLINILCDRGLLAAYADNALRVEEKHIRLVEKELLRTEPSGRGRRRSLLLLGGAVFAVLLLAVGSVFLHPGGKLIQVLSRVNQIMESGGLATSASEPQDGHQRVSNDTANRFARLRALRRGLVKNPASQDLAGVFRRFSDALALKLGVPAGVTPAQLDKICRDAGLELTFFNGTSARLLAFGRPFIMEILLPGEPTPRYLAVLGRQGEDLRVWPDSVGSGLLTVDDFRGLWSGRAFIVWRDFEQIDSLGQVGHRGAKVVRLQKLLQRAGFWGGDPSGVYDEATLEAVTRFQAHEGLIQDGRVGPQTLMLLYLRGGYPVLQLDAIKEKGQAS